MKTYIDLHCHPSLKPFGQACPGITNNPDASIKNSIWHDDPPTGRDKRLNRSLTVTRFSQSNFTELYRGNFRVVVVSLYPVEKGFFTSRTGTGRFADMIYDFTTGIGLKKVDFIQSVQRRIRFLCFTRKKKFRRWNMLVWNQISYIADLLDRNGLPAWDIICIGTDFDGVVSPIDGYWTSSEIKHLHENLLEYAEDYLRHKTFMVPSFLQPVYWIKYFQKML